MVFKILRNRRTPRIRGMGFDARSLAEMESGQPRSNAKLPAKLQKLILTKERDHTLTSKSAERQEAASKQDEGGWLRDWRSGWSSFNCAGNVVHAHRGAVRSKLAEKARGVDPKRAACSLDRRCPVSEAAHARCRNRHVTASLAKQLEHKDISIRTRERDTEKPAVSSCKEVHDPTLIREAETRTGNVRVSKADGNIWTHTATNRSGAEHAGIYRKGKSEGVAGIRQRS